MLDIDPKTIDFLVTDSMVGEAEHLIADILPQLDAILDQTPEPISRVYFVACGSPLCACQTAAMLFERYSSVPCRCFSGWDFLDQRPAVLDGSTLVVGVSDSGNSEEVATSLTEARRAGAPTIGVTKNPTGNLVAEAADAVVAYEGGCIWVLHTLIAYAIAIGVIERAGEGEAVAEIKADMPKVPGVLQRLMTTVEPRSKELGLRASEWPFIYTVAGGNLLPLGYKEGVITMLEFTWTHGSALNSSEFRHGPLEVVDADVPYVFLLGNDPSRHTTERCIRFVEKLSEKVVVFDVAELDTGLHEAYDPIALFVPLEFFYLYLSLGKGHNPDDRRYYGGLVAY
ncbi:SIS domain-containing protein [Actinoallomurus rhizosphaericola]|uniref:SIS domain-containing protein n=1 Tax=Actinoallomurus rhizosphaericola TaxID=2952536 RepID=UPI00209374A0|nr:SIS domain-containing protein [Actinoallomurus rhizosphaericola]MCO5997897.1 SIS domain-containing protein [Actinoallomurus rhizosphaericola]